MQGLDYAICASYLAATVAVGRRSAQQATTSDEYLMAGRSIGCCAIGLSVYAALFSGISMLGNPGYVYTHGPIVFVQALSNYVAVPITAYLFVPFFNGLRLTSAYEYLELRFSLRVRLVGSSLFVLRIYLYLGQALYAPALALEAVANVPILLTVLVAGGVSAGYTYHGGMRTVIWTDIMQFLVLWGGQAVLTVFAWRGVEGDPVAIAESHDRFTFLDWTLDMTSNYSTLNVVIGSIPLFLVQSATDQIAVQRYLTASSVREAQKGLWLKLLVLPFFNPLAYVCGIALFAYFHSGGRTDPVEAGLVKNADEIMPFFAVSEMPAGLSGMLISGILAATMSTTSSGLASVSTAIVTDFVLRLGWAGAGSDDVGRRLQLSRRVVVASSALMVLSAWFVSQLGTQLAELSWVVNGLCGGPLLGMFLLGMLTRTAEEHGAFCGVVAGSCVLLVLMASSRFCAETGSECSAGKCCETWFGWLGRIAFFWYAGIGASVCFTVGYFRSWVFHGRDPRSFASRRKIDGLVVGIGTTRPVDGLTGVIGEPMERATKLGRGGEGDEKERLVGDDIDE